MLPHVPAPVGVLSLLLFVWTFNDFVTPFVFFGQIPPVAGNLFPLNVYTTTFVAFAYSVDRPSPFGGDRARHLHRSSRT